MNQLEAFLVSNQRKSFEAKDGLVEYQEITFLVEDADGGVKPLILRPKNPDIKDLKVTFKEAIKGKFPYGKLTIDYQEQTFADRYDPSRSVVAYKPKFVSFQV